MLFLAQGFMKITNNPNLISPSEDSARDKVAEQVQPNAPGGVSQTADVFERGTPGSFLGDAGIEGGAMDPNELVQTVLRESYLQTTEDLKDFAEKVKFFNSEKQGMRNFLMNAGRADAAEKLSNLQPGPSAGNIMEVIYTVLRESIQDTNEDKSYYLNKLQGMQEINREIASFFSPSKDDPTPPAGTDSADRESDPKDPHKP
jgi:hypothetical protein